MQLTYQINADQCWLAMETVWLLGDKGAKMCALDDKPTSCTVAGIVEVSNRDVRTA